MNNSETFEVSKGGVLGREAERSLSNLNETLGKAEAQIYSCLNWYVGNFLGFEICRKLQSRRNGFLKS